jgi:hypothetical protein
MTSSNYVNQCKYFKCRLIFSDGIEKPLEQLLHEVIWNNTENLRTVLWSAGIHFRFNEVDLSTGTAWLKLHRLSNWQRLFIHKRDGSIN